MNMEEVISKAERNIRTALDDYKRHVSKDSKDYMGDIGYVSDEFISRLARDSSIAKRGLRDLFSKSPAWNEDLDAIVINGTRTHNPNYGRVFRIASEILEDELYDCFGRVNETLYRAMMLFGNPENSDDESFRDSIEAVKEIAPKAYAPGKKRSRVFRDMCVAMGVYNNAPGCKFQRLYAMLADEMNARKIDFKLFVSINPAHFLTMSNPKHDMRGSMLTSCHSLNGEYNYCNGCIGYARDTTSFIVFTVEDPTNHELLNNRKTTRQVFAYRPGSGLLLQSRMYNTSGGVYGAAEDSGLYRDLIQREISDLEGAPNLWTTYPSYRDKSYLVEAGDGFGGYQDWIHDDFDGHISIRNDAEPNPDPLVVGAAGLCVVCGEEHDGGLLCDECDGGILCPKCGRWSQHWHEVVDADGDYIRMCEECCEENYVECELCGGWHRKEDMKNVGGSTVCDYCSVHRFDRCEKCGELRPTRLINTVVNGPGDYEYICEDCIRNGDYISCPHCGNVIHDNLSECPVCGVHFS